MPYKEIRSPSDLFVLPELTRALHNHSFVEITSCDFELFFLPLNLMVSQKLGNTLGLQNLSKSLKTSQLRSNSVVELVTIN